MKFRFALFFCCVFVLGLTSCTGSESDDPSNGTSSTLDMTQADGQWLLSSATMDGAESNMLDDSYFHIDVASSQIKTNMPFGDDEVISFPFTQDGSTLTPEDIETTFEIKSLDADKLIMSFDFANHEFKTTFERPEE